MLFAALKTHRVRPVIALLFAAVIAGCTQSPSGLPTDRTALPPTKTVSLTVAAAASLQNALDAIDPLFTAAYPNIEVFYSSGGSGVLQRQIEQGAPVDVFLSASSEQMDAIAQKNLIQSESRQNILSNQLILITPQNSSLTGFEDLASFPTRREKLAVGEFRSVPAGQYAQATLNKFELLPQLSSQLIFFSSVRGVLAAVESGNVSAGIVYRTDAQLSKKVEVVTTAPADTHPPIRYPAAILKRSSHPEAAQQYIDFLTASAASEVFQQFGFIPLAIQTERRSP